MTLLLFPHYQAVGREKLHLDFSAIVWWVVVQNVGTAVFSVPAGPLADRFGNRLVLQLTMLGLCGAPFASVILAHSGEFGQQWYYVVFGLIGLHPVALRTFNNYTLEISKASDHPRYLSTLSVCMAVPLVLAPLIGFFIDQLGFEPVFAVITGLLLIGWLISMWLIEPRQASCGTGERRPRRC